MFNRLKEAIILAEEKELDEQILDMILEDNFIEDDLTISEEELLDFDDELSEGFF